MDVDRIREICAGFAGTHEDLKWDNDLCFCVGGKIYAVLSLDKAQPSLSFKTSEDLFPVLTAMPGIIPAPYLARYGWVCLERLDALEPSLLASHLADSYSRIFQKLPAKKKSTILQGS